jgi:hypothetical protein
MISGRFTTETPRRGVPSSCRRRIIAVINSTIEFVFMALIVAARGALRAFSVPSCLRGIICLGVLLLLLVAGAAKNAHAQQPGSELRIYVMTLGPGDAVWERFGHNGIVVEDTRNGSSVVYDWGRFSFEQPGYVPRLMKGLMMYWMEGADAQATMNYYAQNNRSVWLQELNLTPTQRIAMAAYLQWNAQEQNKFYRYDYYRDNCSTRVRDAIDRVLGGQLKSALSPIQTTSTFRSHTERLTYDGAATYTGLQLAMGNPIDNPLTAWEETFIPMELMKWLSNVRIRDASGREVPLVTRTVNVFQSQRTGLSENAPFLTHWYLIAGLLIAGLVFLLGRHTPRGARRIALAVIVALWCIVTGFFGLLISLLWSLTDHWVTYYNENVLQANPLLLVLGVLAVIAILRGKAGKTAGRLALVVAGLSVLGFVLQVFPGIDQVNGEIIALMMPVHIAIAYVLSSPRSTVTA